MLFPALVIATGAALCVLLFKKLNTLKQENATLKAAMKEGAARSAWQPGPAGACPLPADMMKALFRTDTEVPSQIRTAHPKATILAPVVDEEEEAAPDEMEYDDAGEEEMSMDHLLRVPPPPASRQARVREVHKDDNVQAAQEDFRGEEDEDVDSDDLGADDDGIPKPSSPPTIPVQPASVSRSRRGKSKKG